MIVRESWVRVRKQLESVGIADAGVEAEVMLRHALDLERADFFAALGDQLKPSAAEQIDRLAHRRVAGEPLAYMVGTREFRGLDFYVNSHVLIPRQETELLVERVLAVSRHVSSQCPAVVDVGTGSGAIAVAIACELRGATVYATDRSREALRVADVNRRRHGVAGRVHLLQGDLIAPLNTRVDVVVANLPYIRAEEIPSLAHEVRREPHAALDGGPNGLEVIGRLLLQARSCVRPGGSVILEIAPEHLESVLGRGRELFPEARVDYHRDLLGLPRALSIELPGGPVGGEVS